MNITNKYLGYEGDITFYMPEWIGRIVCKYKGFHQWEFFAYCHKCGVEFCERLKLDCSPNCKLFHFDTWPEDWFDSIEE